MCVLKMDSHGVSVVCLLKLVDLAMADIVVKVGNRRRRITSLAHVPPALLLLLASIQGQRRRQDHVQSIRDGAGEELNVDVEGHDGLRIGRRARDASDAIVLGLVIVGHREGFLKESGVAAGHCGQFGGGIDLKTEEREEREISSRVIN